MEILLAFLFLFLIVPVSDSDYRCADYDAVLIIGKCVLPTYDAPLVIVIR